MLGTFSGDVALTFGRAAACYLGGGILPRLGTFLQNSAFRSRFEAKGRMQDYVGGIPTYLITAPIPALTGAAAWLDVVIDMEGLVEQSTCSVSDVMRLSPVIPVITIDDTAHAVPMAEALVAGGLFALEVTLRTPEAPGGDRGDRRGGARRGGRRRNRHATRPSSPRPRTPAHGSRSVRAARRRCWRALAAAACPTCRASPPPAKSWPCWSAASPT